jgi:hypothetical protein
VGCGVLVPAMCSCIHFQLRVCGGGGWGGVCPDLALPTRFSFQAQYFTMTFVFVCTLSFQVKGFSQPCRSGTTPQTMSGHHRIRWPLQVGFALPPHLFWDIFSLVSPPHPFFHTGQGGIRSHPYSHSIHLPVGVAPNPPRFLFFSV